ncbi:single-stranded DNA-binding protein [Actinomyces weissii]|uniref:Single-stranded DNA-binding protein n=1 Tax=Actinomyces weissii TaxID=675090 RepID=A0A7T7MBK6_9ACTO|nr:single-stranded DNA-binding protein [Actinomyces weissii]QQM67952.1 single-stranded DNA-binding protein [Actinomyces weissii]
MSRQIDLTIQGVVGTAPALSRATGRAFCRFRVAVTPSHREGQDWVDDPTVWFTAKAWGALAENLSFSLSKGDPVVLVGRFSQERWANERGSGVSNVIGLTTAGHDLSRGESRFGRRLGGQRSEALAPASDTPSAQADSAEQKAWSSLAAGTQAGPGTAETGCVVEPTCEREAELEAGHAEVSETEGAVSSSLPDSTWELPVSDLGPATGA